MWKSMERWEDMTQADKDVNQPVKARNPGRRPETYKYPWLEENSLPNTKWKSITRQKNIVIIITLFKVTFFDLYYY
jgi:hypothetical protein